MRTTTMSFEHHECDARSRVRVTEPRSGTFCFWLAWKTHHPVSTTRSDLSNAYDGGRMAMSEGSDGRGSDDTEGAAI
jgi:hypothetical protein